MQHDKYNQHCDVIYNVKRLDSGHSHHEENFFFPFYLYLCEIMGFPCGAIVKNLLAKQEMRDACSVPGSGRSPGEGNGNSVQYSCLGNPTSRGDWWATVHGVAESHTTEHTHKEQTWGYNKCRKSFLTFKHKCRLLIT